MGEAWFDQFLLCVQEIMDAYLFKLITIPGQAVNSATGAPVSVNQDKFLGKLQNFLDPTEKSLRAVCFGIKCSMAEILLKGELNFIVKQNRGFGRGNIKKEIQQQGKISVIHKIIQ